MKRNTYYWLPYHYSYGYRHYRAGDKKYCFTLIFKFPGRDWTSSCQSCYSKYIACSIKCFFQILENAIFLISWCRWVGSSSGHSRTYDRISVYTAIDYAVDGKIVGSGLMPMCLPQSMKDKSRCSGAKSQFSFIIWQWWRL